MKKRAIAVEYKKGGYRRLAVRLGPACPPASTIRGWQFAEGPLGVPGRPKVMTGEEEAGLLASFHAVRATGATLNDSDLVALGKMTLEAKRSQAEAREVSEGLSRSWAKSFRRRHNITSLFVAVCNVSVDASQCLHLRFAALHRLLGMPWQLQLRHRVCPFGV